ncbi:MAG: CAP domain-containing protein [Lachnospiraceae bacterium]|nr:CAP domain-containing protein [Lachnospiraceae bacterium]
MKKKNIVQVLMCSILMLMLSCPFTSLAAESKELETTEQSVEKSIEDLFILINQKRAEVGNTALIYDSALEKTSGIRVLEISTSFLHTRLDGRHFSTALTDLGISFKRSAEVLAFNCQEANQVLDVWMNSPFHCEAILSPKYTHIGISQHTTADGQIFWTAHLSSQ